MLLCQFLSAQYSSDSIFTRAEQMPYFIGCEHLEDGADEKRQCSNLEMVRFISRHLIYPDSALEAGIEGTVYVSFVVDETGLVQNPYLLMDIGGGCGEAALDIIREMPRWESGRENGQAVKVKLNLPIQFFMKNSDVDVAEPFTLSWGDLKGKTVKHSDLVNNLENAVNVRGPEGNSRYIAELSFYYEKNGKSALAKSNGEINADMKKIARKAKKGGVFTITASMHEKGQFIQVRRSFELVD